MIKEMPKIDYKALEKNDDKDDFDLLKNDSFMIKVRSWLKTEEQKKLFDFIRNVPLEFMIENAGDRWTEERISVHLGIPLERIPTLKRAIKRAFGKQLKLTHIED